MRCIAYRIEVLFCESNFELPSMRPTRPAHLPAVFLTLALLLSACAGGEDTPAHDAPAAAANSQSDTSEHMNALPAALRDGLEAHGGLDTWQSFAALQFDFNRAGGTETQHIDLQMRRTHWIGDGFTLGFDGDSVWVRPSEDAFFGNPRFYNGLHFYFFQSPFVLADHGTVHEDLGEQMIDGTPYRAVKVTYESGVGESPKDAYIAHFDPETGLMKVLLYTVTFNSGEPSDRFSALEYRDYQEVDGLMVPSRYVGRTWNAEERTLGEERYEMNFTDVDFHTEPWPDAMFSPPAQ